MAVAFLTKQFGVAGATDNVGQQFLVVSVEELVLELEFLAVTCGDLLEAIGVQLTDKRAEVVVFEVLRENLRGKGVGVENGERLSITTPANYTLQFLVTQQFPSFPNKGGGSSRHRAF